MAREAFVLSGECVMATVGHRASLLITRFIRPAVRVLPRDMCSCCPSVVWGEGGGA
jgi:hypothetical protein